VQRLAGEFDGAAERADEQDRHRRAEVAKVFAEDDRRRRRRDRRDRQLRAGRRDVDELDAAVAERALRKRADGALRGVEVDAYRSTLPADANAVLAECSRRGIRELEGVDLAQARLVPPASIRAASPSSSSNSTICSEAASMMPR